MATRRTSFDKLQRERAKRAKAADKRERRQERAAGGEDDQDVVAPIEGELSAGELMQRLEALHARYEAKTLDFDSFEEQKLELLERLAALPMD
ncbi:MAG TPA: hypothetical protein VFX21_01215 [Acidimicrobiia bacterium]|nr:hypothetical protein [Acidimicrobiia bacterium]